MSGSLVNPRKKGLIIVTGSCGRIGEAVVSALGKEYQIVGFELLKAIYSSRSEELVPVDISSDESVEQAFRHIRSFYGNKIAAVIHLAAYYSFSDPAYDNYKKITVEGTKRLLKALQGFEVEQFIFSSTMLVHKPCRVGAKITERSPLLKSWAYPRSKIETEEVIKMHHGKIPTVVLRISGVYDDLCHSIPISNEIQRIYEHQLVSHFFPGDLAAGASFIHMDDLVDAIVRCVELRKELPKETTLLLGEERVLSTEQMQRKISDLLFHKQIHTYRIPKMLAWIGAFVQCHIPFKAKPFIRPWMIKHADENYDLDLSRTKKLLRWQPKYDLASKLKVMIDNLKTDPQKWYKVNGLTPSHEVEKLWKKGKKRKSL